MDEDGSVWLKCEGMMKDKVRAPIFEQLAVVRETGLFNEWAPFCNKSRLLTHLGRYDLHALRGALGRLRRRPLTTTAAAATL